MSWSSVAWRVVLGFLMIASFSIPELSLAAPPSRRRPNPPSSLQAALSGSQINLRFVDGSAYETGFEVERSAVGGAFLKITTLAANVTSYSDTQIASANSYSYRVRAFNAYGYSSYSNIATVNVVTAPTPTPSPTPSPTPAPIGSAPAIPNLDRWKMRMAEGKKFCVKSEIDAAINSTGVTTEANVWYYDGSRVYQQIADYTGDTSYEVCAGYSNSAYRSWVLSMSNGVTYPVGKLGGWRIFPHGLLIDYQRRGDLNSREAVRRLALYSAWAGVGGGAECGLSRETAYLIQAYLAGEKAGLARSSNLSTAVNFALGHIDQWVVTKTCEDVHTQPFMMGLTMAALIEYYQATGDARIPPAIQKTLDGMWNMFWVPTSQAFIMNKADLTPAPDLNLLIAPAFAWYWNMTGDNMYLERGDQVFSGGVLGANFWTGKQFSQSYRWSFDYVKWRSAR